MIRRIWTLMKNWRAAKSALSTLSYVYGGQTGYMDALGGLSGPELEGLLDWLPQEGTLVEIGTLFGLAAKRIAAARAHLKIVAVDNFCWNPFGLPPALHREFTEKILWSELRRGQVELCAMDSGRFRATCAFVPDAVFLDADHSYAAVKAEIEWAKRLGVKTICGHDYGNPNPAFGVTKAVDEAFGAVEVRGMCWKGAVA